MPRSVPSGTTSQAHALVRLHQTEVSGSDWVLGRNGLLSDLQPKWKGGEEQTEETSSRFVDNVLVADRLTPGGGSRTYSL